MFVLLLVGGADLAEELIKTGAALPDAVVK